MLAAKKTPLIRGDHESRHNIAREPVLHGETGRRNGIVIGVSSSFFRKKELTLRHEAREMRIISKCETFR
jgi:hypothetical protein